jgi:hypothetical protein
MTAWLAGAALGFTFTYMIWALIRAYRGTDQPRHQTPDSHWSHRDWWLQD